MRFTYDNSSATSESLSNAKKSLEWVKYKDHFELEK